MRWQALLPIAELARSPMPLREPRTFMRTSTGTNPLLPAPADLRDVPAENAYGTSSRQNKSVFAEAACPEFHKPLRGHVKDLAARATAIQAEVPVGGGSGRGPSDSRELKSAGTYSSLPPCAT
jgi:hypothetical protein